MHSVILHTQDFNFPLPVPLCIYNFFLDGPRCEPQFLNSLHVQKCRFRHQAKTIRNMVTRHTRKAWNWKPMNLWYLCSFFFQLWTSDSEIASSSLALFLDSVKRFSVSFNLSSNSNFALLARVANCRQSSAWLIDQIQKTNLSHRELVCPISILCIPKAFLDDSNSSCSPAFFMHVYDVLD